jgi:sulfite reductase (NADPH) flavoprotein alpha-component
MRPFVHPLRLIHRWLALAVSPFLLLIILSGMILAFRPILSAAPAGGVNVSTLVAAMDQADPHGHAASLEFSADGRSLQLRSRRSGPDGLFDAASGVQTGELGFDLFAFARSLHEGLLIHANWLITLVTIVTVFLIGSGLFLGWRRLRNTWSGWHAALGWLALPLVLLTPLTGMLMALHIGSARMPYHESGGRPLSLAAAIEIASHEVNLTRLVSARSFRRGSVMLAVQDGAGTKQYLVSDRGGVQPNAGPGWIRMLHEGTWAGAWSGVLTLLSVVPLLGLWFTGLVPWLRRARQAGEQSSTHPKNMASEA